MNPPCHDDPFTRALATLPPVLPNQARADQLRARCRAQLERPPRHMPVFLEPATISAVCAVYAWQIIRIVTRLSGGGLQN